MIVEEKLSNNENIRIVYNDFDRKVIINIIDCDEKLKFLKCQF